MGNGVVSHWLGKIVCYRLREGITREQWTWNIKMNWNAFAPCLHSPLPLVVCLLWCALCICEQTCVLFIFHARKSIISFMQFFLSISSYIFSYLLTWCDRELSFSLAYFTWQYEFTTFSLRDANPLVQHSNSRSLLPSSIFFHLKRM